MANWQDELESLLASFGVALEAPALDQLRAEDSLNRYLLAQPEQSEPPVEHGVEVIAVQSEVEATVRQVVSLVRSGSIDSALREDVAFVLRALTRPDAATSNAAKRYPPRQALNGTLSRRRLCCVSAASCCGLRRRNDVLVNQFQAIHPIKWQQLTLESLAWRTLRSPILALRKRRRSVVKMRTRECSVSSHTLLILVSCSSSSSGDSRQMSSRSR